MMIAENTSLLEARAREALSRISSVRELDGRLMIDLPVMYPSGSMVVVEVERNRDRYWVSDAGHGLIEAEFMGAVEFFPRSARKSAEDFAVDFDGNAMFALWVSDTRLEAAIAAVANASSVASHDAIRRASEVQGRRQNEKIFEQISRVFGAKTVARSAEINGRHATWDAHNVVIFPNQRKAIFEYMTEHSNSVSSKFLMFSDIRAKSDETSLNAVVRRIDQLDRKAQLVGDVANILPLDASDDVYRRSASAA